MWRSSIPKKLAVLIAPLLFIVVLISSIFHFGFDKQFLYEVYETNQLEQRLNIDTDDLHYCTNVLFEQIQGLRQDLDCEVMVDNSYQQFFNQREADHMVDVQALYLGAVQVRNGAIVGIVVLLLMLALEPVSFRFNLYTALKKGYLFLAAGLLVLGLFIVADFQRFWTVFHKIFFRNDLWLLNPATDRLINLVPENFFEPLVIKIFTSTALIMAGVYVFFELLNRKQKTVMPTIHMVLFEPEIPQNTGNIMRTCAAAQFHLHIIEPTGFILDEKKLKRSAMDYQKHTELTIHDDWAAFEKTVKGSLYFVTRYGKHPASSFDFTKVTDNIYLVFGKESTGIPLDLLKQHQEQLIRIPMHPQARSLNLSNSVAIVGYEVLRQFDYGHLSLVEELKGEDWINQNNHFS